MDKEYCKGCSSFYVYLATLAPPDEQFTPTCTITGGFVPISEIKKCTMKNKIRGTMKSVEDDWQLVCLSCNGKGYEEKLSCGCTGYRMRKYCTNCKGKGAIDV